MINDDNYFRYRIGHLQIRRDPWIYTLSSVNINECAGNLIMKVYYTRRDGRARERRGGMFGEISRTGEDRLNVKGEN